jgi:hypothetical protein
MELLRVFSEAEVIERVAKSMGIPTIPGLGMFSTPLLTCTLDKKEQDLLVGRGFTINLDVGISPCYELWSAFGSSWQFPNSVNPTKHPYSEFCVAARFEANRLRGGVTIWPYVHLSGYLSTAPLVPSFQLSHFNLCASLATRTRVNHPVVNEILVAGGMLHIPWSDARLALPELQCLGDLFNQFARGKEHVHKLGQGKDCIFNPRPTWKEYAVPTVLDLWQSQLNEWKNNQKKILEETYDRELQGLEEKFT